MRLQTNLHYQASFNVRCSDPEAEAWKLLVKTVRSWMREKSQLGEAIGGSWFYTYGKEEHATIRNQFVETSREIGNGSNLEPEFWASRMQIQDRSFVDRYWRTDIGLVSRGNGEYTIGVTVQNFLRPGYLGPEPVAPSFSAPQIVERLLSDYWLPHSGDLPLTNGPLNFSVSDVPHILSLLESTERKCPIVWVTREKTHRDPIIAPQGLTAKIAGAAAILVSADGDAESALIEALPRRFRAMDGMVRIYQPGVRLDLDSDAGRHRYYSRNQIEDLGPSQVAVEIIRALTRRIDLGRHDALFSLEEVSDQHRRNRVRMLREMHTPESDKELVDLLEADNSRLGEQVESLQKAKEELEFELEVVREAEQQARDQQAYQISLRVEAEKQLGLAYRSQSAIDEFRTLPRTIRECAEKIAALHPNKITFTQQAFHSADQAEFNSVREDLPEVWSLLWSISTDLHALIFDESLDRWAIESEFKARSGFDFSFTESDTTRKDNKLMAKRKFVHDSKDMMMEPHAKLDRSDRNRYLRVHFAIDYATKMIVVNHCGDHLENAATRKRN